MLLSMLCRAFQRLSGGRCPPWGAAAAEEEETPPGESRPENADDLKAIKGIGIVIENRLMAAGITTYEQLARSTAAEIREALGGRGGEATVEEWIRQARNLAQQHRPGT